MKKPEAHLDVSLACQNALGSKIVSLNPNAQLLFLVYPSDRRCLSVTRDARFDKRLRLAFPASPCSSHTANPGSYCIDAPGDPHFTPAPIEALHPSRPWKSSTFRHLSDIVGVVCYPDMTRSVSGLAGPPFTEPPVPRLSRLSLGHLGLAIGLPPLCDLT